MTMNEPGRENGHDGRTDFDDRDARALTECMSVLPEGGDIFEVVGENGGTYRVDAREGRCTCPDHKHRNARCKHKRRVAFATGERPVPAWVKVSAVDSHLGEHTNGQPYSTAEELFLATDGGDIIEADDDGEILTDDDGRPDDCQCAEFLADAGLPCWPCYRDGFEVPASADD